MLVKVEVRALVLNVVESANEPEKLAEAVMTFEGVLIGCGIN